MPAKAMIHNLAGLQNRRPSALTQHEFVTPTSPATVGACSAETDGEMNRKINQGALQRPVEGRQSSFVTILRLRLLRSNKPPIASSCRQRYSTHLGFRQRLQQIGTSKRGQALTSI